MVVTPTKSFEDILWLHERGHSVGRPHAEGEGSLDSFVTENIGKRVMFWMLGTDHLGVLPAECAAFKAHAIASAEITATIDAAAAIPAVSPDHHGLTEKAFAVIGPPWVHGMPIEVVRGLGEEDLKSVRAMLEGEPNKLWPNAINVLAFLGKSEDAELIKRALNLPLAATLPGASAEARAAGRTLLQIKLAAPTALGILANRTGETSIETLKEITSDKTKSELLVGKALSEELTKSALTGLAISNRPEATDLVNKAIRSQAITSSSGATIKLSPSDLNKIDSISKSLPAGLMRSCARLYEARSYSKQSDLVMSSKITGLTREYQEAGGYLVHSIISQPSCRQRRRCNSPARARGGIPADHFTARCRMG